MFWNYWDNHGLACKRVVISTIGNVLVTISVVNKDTRCKAKAKAKDMGNKAKARPRPQKFTKAKAKAKDLNVYQGHGKDLIRNQGQECNAIR